MTIQISWFNIYFLDPQYAYYEFIFIRRSIADISQRMSPRIIRSLRFTSQAHQERPLHRGELASDQDTPTIHSCRLHTPNTTSTRGAKDTPLHCMWAFIDTLIQVDTPAPPMKASRDTSTHPIGTPLLLILKCISLQK